MPAENPRVLQERYWLDESWEENEGTTCWSAFDQQDRAEVFVQQLRPRTAWPQPPAKPKPPSKAAAKAGSKTDPDKAQVAVPGDLPRQVRRVHGPHGSHLLSVHAVFEQHGSLWVVMDPVQPFTLHQLLKEQGKLGGTEAAYLGLEMATALQELHDAGVVHGRLDPHDVFFRDDRTLALAGYGLTPSPHDEQGPWVRPWRPDSRYTAPEMADRKAERPPLPTRSADLWAMGMVLYEILSGRRSLLYGPLRRFRWVRTVHDARPPRLAGEPELTLLLALLLSPHPGARTSAAPAVVTLRRLAREHRPLAGGHWAVANRPPRSAWERVREHLVRMFTAATSRAMAGFLTGVLVTLVTLFGWHLVTRPSNADPAASLLSGLGFGVAYGAVMVASKASWHCLALWRARPARWPWRSRDPDAYVPASAALRAAASPPPAAPVSAVSPPPPAALGELPACTPRLRMRGGPVQPGRAVRLEFSLDVPAGHPWYRAAGDTRDPAELMLVASARSGGSTLVPPCAGYRVQDPEGGPAAFTFTAHAAGPHTLRITVYDRVHGVVLQELNATLESAEPAVLGSARHEGPEF
ncbi:protein kinase domain-containing protein [Streptomyces sp. NBC_00207]|uniref:protein kinase domain-containing protein n=1 Tax=Streptomyces sp. NBC_00207 TaxID=2903635 RepID=UPI003245EE2E